LIPFVNRKIEHLNLPEGLNEFTHHSEVGFNIPKTEIYARTKHLLCRGKGRERPPSEALFTPLEIMPRCSAAGLDFRIIPAGFNAPLEFLTGFTKR